MAPKVLGYVVELLIDDNKRVRAGDLLLRIDPRDYLAARDQAAASLALGRARLAEAKGPDFKPPDPQAPGGWFDSLFHWSAPAKPATQFPDTDPEGGRLVSALRLAEAQQAETALNYRRTVLNALGEVEIALIALRTDQGREQA
jgi:multidrug efflux pump subunit AcrA (membrane-fusion protein)